MANSYISSRNLRFLLLEVLKAPSLNQFEHFQDYDEEVFKMTLQAAKQIGDQHLFPILQEMDREKAYYQDGEVHVHPGLKKAIKAIAEAGWIAAPDTYEWEGQQMPACLLNAGLFTFYSANANAACYAFLTQGAARLIRSFGSEKLNQDFVPKMYRGDWQGTMALTEPQAGSSLTDITTSATPTEGGSYKIKGQKIYISGGDHTAVENVVHLLLARIDGAPVGTKGISLFVVPKLRTENGELVANDVTTAGIFGKMGQKGYVAAHIMLGEKDDCHGYLLGKAHHGLSYMFQMMNEARIGTGLVSAGVASAAYYASLQYANERPQGRHPSKKDPNLPQVLIIEHADVKRQLLFQKAVVEGSISLLLQCSYYADLAEVAEGDEKQRAHLLLELLTPIAKSYPAEMGIHSVSAGIQTLGGAGYCNDFPLEQLYRDIRVNAIYEGTTAIHGMDLLGRKIMLEKGKGLRFFMEEITQSIKIASGLEALHQDAQKLGTAASSLHQITLHLIGLASQEKPEVFLADATIYLEFFGTVTIGWQWLKQGIIAAQALEKELPESEKIFYQSKLYALQYFMEYELPKTQSHYTRLFSQNRLTVEMDPKFLI